VKIKPRHEILNEIIQQGKKHPTGWKAVFGKDYMRMSRDYYLFNPDIGIYLLKEYQKNPYQIKGIGGKIARHIDEDIENNIAKNAGGFGIVKGDIQRILRNLEKGIQPKKIFNAAIQGKENFGLSMPIRGSASESEDIFKNLHLNLSTKQKKIDNKFKEIATEEGLYKTYD
jgi:hypothetical protein